MTYVLKNTFSWFARRSIETQPPRRCFYDEYWMRDFLSLLLLGVTGILKTTRDWSHKALSVGGANTLRLDRNAYYYSTVEYAISEEARRFV